MSTALLVAMDKASSRTLSASRSLAEVALRHVASADEALRALDGSAQMDAFVIGPLIDEPVPLVQRAHQQDRDLAVLIFAAPERFDEVCGRLATTPFVGADTRCLPAGSEIDRRIREAVENTRRRRSYREAMAAASAKLMSTAPAAPRTPPVLDRLLDLAPVGVLSLDANGVVVTGNRAASQILGASAEQLLGTPVSGLLADGTASTWQQMLATARESAETPEALMDRRVEGRTQHLAVRVASAEVKVHEPGYLVIVEDVTDRVVAARERDELVHQLEKAVEARDEFISIAAHELRTPLTPLKLLLQNMKGGLEAAPPEVAHDLQRSVERADRQVNRLVALVNGLLDVSRLQSGTLELHRARTDLSTIVSGVVEHFRDELQRQGSPVDLHLGPAVCGVWDEVRIEQVVTNLMSNAIRYGAQKPIEVRVWKADGRAILEVHDQGLGIASDRLEAIFDRFERGGLSENYGGLGLGLFIARQIVQAHGGSIRVESTPDRGTTFRVELPLEPTASPDAPASC